jgi:uncharacterized protein (DUF1697 family)
MTTHIALLRGINVGGNNIIAMADLREFLTKLGMKNARTLLQSGNAVFGSDKRKGDALERFLETESKKRFGLSVDYVVRTADEWQEAIDENPFPKEAKSDPGRLIVMFMKAAAEAKKVKELQAAIQGPETVRAVGKQLYIIYPDGQGKSKLTITLIERKIGASGTGRNWNTVQKLAALTLE